MIKECEERDKADSRAERETLKSIKFMYQRDAAQKELDNLKNGGEGRRRVRSLVQIQVSKRDQRYIERVDKSTWWSRKRN